MAGLMASLKSDRVVHGIVSEGQSTLPFRREGVEKCGYSVCCSLYVDDGVLLLLLSTTLRSMSVMLTLRCCCVWPRRYRAVLKPAIPPPRMIMCCFFCEVAADDDVKLREAILCSANATASDAAEDRYIVVV